MFPSEISNSGENGGGGNRTRVADYPTLRDLQEKLLERVYFIQEGRDYEGPIKIGRTYGDARARLNALQVANWRPLELLGQFWVRAGTELQLHRELSEHRVRGEWYRPHDDVWDEIEECADEQFFAKIGWGAAA